MRGSKLESNKNGHSCDKVSCFDKKERWQKNARGCKGPIFLKGPDILAVAVPWLGLRVFLVKDHPEEFEDNHYSGRLG